MVSMGEEINDLKHLKFKMHIDPDRPLADDKVRKIK